MEDIDDNSYIIFAQANVWKSPNACHELGYYINKLMSCYKYDGPDQAGLVVNRRPEPDINYRTRLENVGIRINDSDRVISRPNTKDREKGLKARRNRYKERVQIGTRKGYKHKEIGKIQHV